MAAALIKLNREYEASKLLLKIKIDDDTLFKIIVAHAEAGNISKAKKYMQYFAGWGKSRKAYLLTKIAIAYINVNDTKSAFKCLSDVNEDHYELTYCAIIGALAKKGKLTEAISVLKQLKHNESNIILHAYASQILATNICNVKYIQKILNYAQSTKSNMVEARTILGAVDKILGNKGNNKYSKLDTIF